MRSLILSIFLTVFSFVLIYGQESSQTDTSYLYRYSQLKNAMLMESGTNNSLDPNSKNFNSQENYFPSFFCRMENEWDKLNKINSRFRLGSIEHANYLEGK